MVDRTERDGFNVVSVTEVRIYSASYVDGVGKMQVMPVAVIDGEVAKFKDDQLVIDRRATPEFIVEGVKAHVEALSEEGDEEV